MELTVALKVSWDDHEMMKPTRLVCNMEKIILSAQHDRNVGPIASPRKRIK